MAARRDAQEKLIASQQATIERLTTAINDLSVAFEACRAASHAREAELSAKLDALLRKSFGKSSEKMPTPARELRKERSPEIAAAQGREKRKHNEERKAALDTQKCASTLTPIYDGRETVDDDTATRGATASSEPDYKFQLKLIDGAAAAAGPAFGWMYQHGRGAYFHLPVSLIRIGLAHTAFALLLVVPLMLAVAGVVATGMRADTNKDFIRPWSVYGILICIGFWAAVGSNEESWFVPLFIAIGVAAVASSPLVFMDPNRKSILKKLGPVAGISLFTVVGCLASYRLGIYRAEHQRYFWLLPEQAQPEKAQGSRPGTPLIALALYDDLVITAPLASKKDPEGRALLEPSIVIRKIGEGTTSKHQYFDRGVGPE